jgi:hypothetical protein
MAAKPIAAMELGVPPRSYKYPQADRHDFLQFAARQRDVVNGRDIL